MAGVEDVNHYFFRQAARVLALSPRVERLLVTPYREVKVAREHRVPFRTAAFIVAIGRVGRATVLRGV